ncbi:hypothetical protein JX265_006114 [Neoarthrinium moseri]|uniref:Glutathione S-transferase n=1 Tax=Neoarthrinium moseri TaxID=1658444 RepID=A0A9P9WMN9_9PEZI|nr:hypothetical protein JX266_013137 [Neoarthrinium moseri]KAI1871074.1 hypothetical protein JX265_006114 [Neoarthrinium moseri]
MANGKPTLYHLNNSQSQTILWLLEELGIEYDLKLFNRIEQRSPPELKETHPTGKSPQLMTPTGRVITERSAIALYLIETYDTSSKFKIPSPPAQADDDFLKEDSLISFGNSTVMPLFMLRLVFMQLVKRTPFFLRWLVSTISSTLDKAFLSAEIELHLSYFDSLLEGREYVMGGAEPTRADFVNLWYFDWGAQGKYYEVPKYKNIDAWRQRCLSRPAWKRALEKGNGYDLSEG